MLDLRNQPPTVLHTLLHVRRKVMPPNEISSDSASCATLAAALRSGQRRRSAASPLSTRQHCRTADR